MVFDFSIFIILFLIPFYKEWRNVVFLKLPISHGSFTSLCLLENVSLNSKIKFKKKSLCLKHVLHILFSLSMFNVLMWWWLMRFCCNIIWTSASMKRAALEVEKCFFLVVTVIHFFYSLYFSIVFSFLYAYISLFLCVNEQSRNHYFYA